MKFNQPPTIWEPRYASKVPKGFPGGARALKSGGLLGFEAGAGHLAQFSTPFVSLTARALKRARHLAARHHPQATATTKLVRTEVVSSVMYS